jgi:hypothetical protein
MTSDANSFACSTIATCRAPCGCATWRASQLIDVLESQIDEWLQALDTFARWATDREPVDKSLIDKLEVCSLFLSVTCHVVLRLHTFSDRAQFGWQVIGGRVFESRKMRDHASDQLA